MKLDFEIKIWKKMDFEKPIRDFFGNQIKFVSYTLGPEQNVPHYADDILKCIFLNEHVLASIEDLLMFVPSGLIENAGLVQIISQIWLRFMTSYSVVRPR